MNNLDLPKTDFFCKLCSDQVLFANTQQTQNTCITFVQCQPNVFDVGPTLYKCYTNVLCLLGKVFKNNQITVSDSQ